MHNYHLRFANLLLLLLKLQYPTRTHTLKCAALTLIGAVIASGYEALFILGWISGTIPYSTTVFDSLMTIPKLMIQIAIAGYVADIHFWLVHRMMHPWGTGSDNIDPGEYLYQNFHSTHHMSVNPGPVRCSSATNL